MNPESLLTNKIARALRARGVYVVKIHGSAMQQTGLPDLWCVWRGRLFCLEVKIPGGKATARQVHEMERLRKAGAEVDVVRSVDEAIGLVFAIRGD